MADSGAVASLEDSILCLPGSEDSAGAREVLQERLAFFAKVIFTLCFGFYVAGNFLQMFKPESTWLRWIDRPPEWFHLAAVTVWGGMWWFAARGHRSRAQLRLVDSVGTILACTFYALVSWTYEEGPSDHLGLLAATNTLIARAVLVPSRPGRTFWIGTASFAPSLLVASWSFSVPDYPYRWDESALVSSAFFALWCVAAVAVSAVTSSVIYGLRSEVREARKLGQYTLEEKIGAGGMGEVYKARHAMLRRPTAIKLLRCDVAGERSIARFEREVQLTSRLTHPNTIAIYDYGRTPEGVFYYAMEYLPGLTLEQLVKKNGPQAAGRAVFILKQVCASLSEAHGTGLIHRDIKAANVILSERGGAHDVVKVVDFGLVKDLDNLEDAGVSAANTITGTPHYLSPEALRSPAEVGPKSDLYAVGVLGYFLLTGTHVFEAESFVEVCSHHLQTPPTPPSQRVPVPADLEKLILQCLEKEAEKRPEGAWALRQSLGACECSRDWNQEKAEVWWKELGDVEMRPSRAEPTAVVAHSTADPTGTVIGPARE